MRVCRTLALGLLTSGGRAEEEGERRPAGGGGAARQRGLVKSDRGCRRRRTRTRCWSASALGKGAGAARVWRGCRGGERTDGLRPASRATVAAGDGGGAEQGHGSGSAGSGYGDCRCTTASRTPSAWGLGVRAWAVAWEREGSEITILTFHS